MTSTDRIARTAANLKRAQTRAAAGYLPEGYIRAYQKSYELAVFAAQRLEAQLAGAGYEVPDALA